MRISSNDEGVDLSNGLEVVVEGGDVRIMVRITLITVSYA